MRTAQTLISDDWLRSGVDALVILVEAAGALVIVAGAFLAFVRFVRVLPRRNADAWTAIASAAALVAIRKLVVLALTSAPPPLSASGPGRQEEGRA